jgi:hypothetical protein
MLTISIPYDINKVLAVIMSYSFLRKAVREMIKEYNVSARFSMFLGKYWC